MLRLFSLVGCALLSVGCSKTLWKAGTGVLAPVRQVAVALEDPIEIDNGTPFNSAAIPVIDPPRGLRPCCAFGDDLKVKLGVAEVPGVQKQNVTQIEDLGAHGYDNGLLGIESSHGRSNIEKDGLIYTCRGGFIDTAHVRDNADLTLFLSMHLARTLPLGTTIEMPPDGTQRRVTVKKLPDGFLSKHGRWFVATTLAQWIAFQLSIWHEVVTWYGWQNVKGFSEKLSSFSPEDLYSNILGLRLAGGLIRHQDARTREEYDRAMDAWIKEALRRLGAVSKQQGKVAMKAVDGLWWDSSKPVPETAVVKRRNFHIKPPESPWLVSEALPKDKTATLVEIICPGSAPPLVLDVPDKIGDVKISDLVAIDFAFKGWAPDDFPYPDPATKVVTIADLPAIVETIRKEAAKELGPDVDRPTASLPPPPPPVPAPTPAPTQNPPS